MNTYKQPSFQEYRNQISIIELALHAGYEWQPKKGKTLPVLYHAGFDDHIVVKNPNDSSNQVYFQPGSYSDRGTLINFVSNRLTSCFSQFNNPNRSPAQCVNDVLKEYLGIVPEQKRLVKKLEDSIHQSFREAGTEKEFSLEQYKLSQLPKDNFLTLERYIHPDLLSTAQFLDTIALQRIYFMDGKPVPISGGEQSPNGERIVENIAFPYLSGDRNVINGLELRNTTYKSHATGSDRGHGVWISNPNELPTSRLVVGESAIDMLSYRQLELSTGLHPQTDSRYASIGGSLSLDHLTTLMKFMDPDTKLVFGFDNDDKGARYALTALTAFSKDGITLTQAAQQGYVALKVPSQTIEFELTSLMEEHTKTLKNYVPSPKETGEMHEGLSRTIFHWRQKATVPTLEIPINTMLLNSVNNLLLQHGQFSCSLAIARPRGKDFNEDLKAEYLRQVKRPILLIIPEKGQILHRAKTEEEAWQFLEKNLVKKAASLPVGTELQLIKTNPKQLTPVPLEQIRITATGIEKNLSDTFITAANRQRLEHKIANEKSI
jgi:hypothetical protein